MSGNILDFYIIMETKYKIGDVLVSRYKGETDSRIEVIKIINSDNFGKSPPLYKCNIRVHDYSEPVTRILDDSYLDRWYTRSIKNTLKNL